MKNAGGTTLAAFTYDAQGRRVTEAEGGTTTALYYSKGWQVLEADQSGTATQQYVWSPFYVDGLVERDDHTPAEAGTALDRRLYAEQDADYNVTSLTNASGSVVERYVYDPYGAVTVENPDGSVRGDGSASASLYGSVYLHQGLRLDVVTGTYYARDRVYDVDLDRFLQGDPAGYVDGPNRYQFELDNPEVYTDPSGRQAAGGGEEDPDEDEDPVIEKLKEEEKKEEEIIRNTPPDNVRNAQVDLKYLEEEIAKLEGDSEPDGPSLQPADLPTVQQDLKDAQDEFDRDVRAATDREEREKDETKDKNPCDPLARLGRPPYANNAGGFVNWLKNLQRSGTMLTKEEADALIQEAQKLGVYVRLDPPHPGTNWNVPHLNLGNGGPVHLQVPAGYFNPTVPLGSPVKPR